MTHKEIIEMARQAGCPMANMMPMYFTDTQLLVMLETFAKLVAEKVNADWSETNERLIKVFNEKADLAYLSGAKEEREACAKLIESHGHTLANGFMLTEAIRARGQA